MNPQEAYRYRNSLGTLCYRYNVYSNPSKLMTNHEHRRTRCILRAILRRIERRFRYGIDYREFDNGSLWPLRQQ
jgi:hypothetical protein